MNNLCGFLTRKSWKIALLLILLLIIYKLNSSDTSISPFYTSQLRTQNLSLRRFVQFRDLSVLINTCEQMSTIDCLNYLHNNQSDYLQVLSTDQTDVFRKEYCSEKKKMLFHTFWSDPSTLDDPLLLLHIQSHLYTQNRQCSNLIIWTLPRLFGDIDQRYNTHAPYLQFRSLVSLADEFQEVGVNVNSLWTRLYGRSLSVHTAILSDAVRFVVLHKYGGMYIDADILLLRDLQPLYLHEFAYRWSTLNEFNTAVLRLYSQSKISSKLLDQARQHQDPYIFYPTTLRSHLDPMVLNRLPCIFFDPLWLVADSSDGKSSQQWGVTADTQGVFETVFRKGSSFSQQGRHVFHGAFAFHWHSLHRASIFEQGSYLDQWNEFFRDELFYNDYREYQETSINQLCASGADFHQWKDSMAMEVRMPGGLSSESREKFWISLAKQHVSDIHLDWEKTRQFAFNPDSYPEDEQLNHQIIKDLHRTGCNWSSNENNRIILQRVLLAFARYNKSVGYCQGLHILTSVILDVVHMNEEYALMILIYLIDRILPDFFSNNLHALAMDITVFDQWLKISNPQLHLHLEKLQASHETYEPPLLNVFTIQWFLTLFATCLPREVTLRVWDVLMIEGSEVLFRTGLLLWSKLSIAVLKVSTADQFYSAMGHLSVQLLDKNIIRADNLVQDIYKLGPFPTVILAELRQKYVDEQTSETIKTKQQTKSKVRPKGKFIDDELVNFISCFAILSSSSRTSRFQSIAHKSNPPDIDQLRQQYQKLKQRNKQVQIMTQVSNEQHQHASESVCSIAGGPLINHLLVKPTDVKRNQLKKHVSIKSSAKDESDDLHNEIEQLLTCLNLDKSSEQKLPSSTTTDPYLDRLLTSRSSSIPKYSSFNPFPTRSFNENVAVNGYRLGLYSPVLTSR